MDRGQREHFLAATVGCDLKALRRLGLSFRDFQDLQAEENDSHRIGAAIIHYFCVDESSSLQAFNGFFWGIIIATKFMESETGRAADKQLFQDVKNMFDTGRIDQIESYFRDYFR